ncbi:Putative zinc-finger [Ruminococcus sp. YRD2003]|uniref:zf-HC2 domain-containing protein n=1 Tax=Ruminococcus sp. YRD2003 TaxID=1452313 RepID=UPI0008C36EED|nr:Putative zinc-finger [Ruminococcus flavefaciens]
MNKNEISCNTIIDLMPIYKENSCSEETRLLVEEHLSGCKSCRSLSEAFYVSEPVKAELPNEAETFRKVGRKLKRSRFTKAMAVLMCFCVILFAAVNGAWYFLKYRPMKQMCKGMSQIGTGDMRETPNGRKLSIYVAQDENYFYSVRLPNYLNFGMGTATVAPIGAMGIDENGMNYYNDCTQPILTIPYDVFGTDHYFVNCSSADSGEGFVFETDTGLSRVIKPALSSSGETSDIMGEISDMNDILETHKEELAAMKQAAMDRWGKYLK